jgi:hypothetical protein
MDKTTKTYLKFEILSESKAGNLVNGFSTAIGVSDVGGRFPLPDINSGCTNNCQGGNCVPGCGKSDAVIICVLK